MNTPQNNVNAKIEQLAGDFRKRLTDRVESTVGHPQEKTISVIDAAQTNLNAILSNPHLTSLFHATAMGSRGAIQGSQFTNADLQVVINLAVDTAFKAALQFDVYQNQTDLMDYKGCNFLIAAPKAKAEQNGKIIQP